MTAEREGTGLVIVVNLPQTIGKVSMLLEAISNIWPGTTLNVKPDEAAAKLGNWLIEVEPDP